MSVIYFSVIVNLVLFYSVFELHFGALESNERVDCNVSLNASSKRVVLFLADGLSAQLLYNVTANINDSYIRRVMEKEGSWGVSEASLPTLSRSAAFTYLAGMDFDTALFWNYLGFSKFEIDMIFHYANEVFYTGDPAVLDYFDLKITSKWHKWTWDSKFEQKVGSNYKFIDDFVFQKLNRIFSNSSLNETLHKDKLIFFVYVIGSDDCGHNNLPFSSKCVSLVKNLDSNLEKTVKEFLKYYKDDETSFILTADHGMSETGTHGGGEDILRETPFVVWGSGIRRGIGQVQEDRLSKVWKTEKLPQVKIKQNDIAPLISALLGNPSPYHSIGFLPTEILRIPSETLINSLACNEKHVLSVVEQVAKSVQKLDIQKDSLKKFKAALKTKNVSEIIVLSKELHSLHRNQISLYRDYFKIPIMILVSLIYIGWGIYLFENIFHDDEMETLKSELRNINNCSLGFFMTANCSAQAFVVVTYNWPKRLILFSVFASLIWFLAIKNCLVFRKLIKKRENLMWAFFTSIFTAEVIASVNLPVARQSTVIIMALIFYFINHTQETSSLLGWIASSFLLAFFMDSEIIDELPDTYLIKLGGIFWVLFGVINLYYWRDSFRKNAVSFALLFILIVALLNVLGIYELVGESKVDKHYHVRFSWYILCLTPLAPFFASSTGLGRLVHFCLSLGPGFILLSVRQEAAGLAAFCINLLIWYYMEEKKPKTQIMSRDDFLRGLMLLIYTWAGFFCIGNKDSVTSFNTYWTDCLMNSFHQSTVTLLIIYKLLTPFVILCFVFCALKKELRNHYLKWYLFLNNIVSLYFFFCTKGMTHRMSAIDHSLSHHSFSTIFPILVVVLLFMMDLVYRIDMTIVYKLFFAYLRQIEKTMISKFKNKEIY